jgi:hypothetical protein
VSTVLTLDPDSGALVSEWGGNLFYMPHGIAVDADDNTWLTDVALHQVFKVGKPDCALCNPLKIEYLKTKKTKLHGLSQRANYTDRATAACRRSDCQLLRIEGATWSV